jgi:quinol monooxygenase YgiN
MYGLIGKFTAVPGARDRLIEAMLREVGALPGCLSYVVARDPADADAIWITEVWVDEQSHKASLAIPAVRALIEVVKPLIAGFGPRYVTEPVGGHGLRDAVAAPDAASSHRP